MQTNTNASDIINFLLIGAQKGGTTWLADMLRQHPEVFVPETKELHFYSNRDNFDLGYADYFRHFQGSEHFKRVGEATPNYFWPCASEQESSSPRFMSAVDKISQDLPDIKLLLSLRDPIRRAISAFTHHRARGKFQPHKTLRDVAHTYGIVSMGKYADHWREWLKHYDPEAFCVLVFEEDILPNDAKRATINKVCSHLEIGAMPENVDYSQRSNDQLDPAMAYLSRLPFYHNKWRAKQAAEAMNSIIPKSVQNFLAYTVTDADIDFLKNEFGRQIEDLERMLDRSLPWER